MDDVPAKMETCLKYNDFSYQQVLLYRFILFFQWFPFQCLKNDAFSNIIKNDFHLFLDMLIFFETFNILKQFQNKVCVLHYKYALMKTILLMKDVHIRHYFGGLNAKSVLFKLMNFFSYKKPRFNLRKMHKMMAKIIYCFHPFPFWRKKN